MESDEIKWESFLVQFQVEVEIQIIILNKYDKTCDRCTMHDARCMCINSTKTRAENIQFVVECVSTKMNDEGKEKKNARWQKSMLNLPVSGGLRNVVNGSAK